MYINVHGCDNAGDMYVSLSAGLSTAITLVGHLVHLHSMGCLSEPSDSVFIGSVACDVEDLTCSSCRGTW